MMKMKKIGLIFFFTCFALLFYCSNIVQAYSPGTNITVCVDDNLNIFDPEWPDINFTVSGNPFYFYQVQVDKWDSVTRTYTQVYDSGQLVPSSTNPGPYKHLIPPGNLPVDGSGYAARVMVSNNRDWTPWAVGTFVLDNRDGECGTSSGGTFCPHSLPSLAYPELCLRYSLSDPPVVSGSGDNGTTWSWICSGQASGAPVSCTAQAQTIAPSCGSVMNNTICNPGGTITDATPGLCTTSATPPHVTGDGSDAHPWTWTCSATCGGGDATCSRSFSEKVNPICGDASGQNYCGKNDQPDLAKMCSPNSSYQAGSLINNYTEWTWTCGGTCTSDTITCSGGNSRSCGWIETN